MLENTSLRSCLTALLLACSPLAAAAAEQAPQVTLQMLPAEASVPPQGGADALLVVRNAGGERLHGLRLSWFTPAGVAVTPESARLPALGPYGEVGWKLRLSRLPEGPLRGEVHLRLDYTWAREGGPVPRVAVASFKVGPQQPEAVEQVASLEVKTAMKSLVEHRPGRLYLVITNTSNGPVDVLSVAPRAPGFVSVQALEETARKALPPRDSLVIPFKVEAGGSLAEPIQPGKHMILFRVLLEWRSGGRRTSGSLVASQETDVGVLGESEILTALGVPTFLILPGFLMLVTFQLLWKNVPSRTGQVRKDFSLASKSPEFWLVAITLSVLAAALYPWLTGLFGEPHSYLEGYGLADVIRVWMGSIVLAGLVFLVWTTLADRAAERRKAKTFATTDLPLQVLRKLELQGAKVYRPRADVKIGGQVQRAFVLNRTGDQLWVSPGIRLTGLAKTAAEVQQEIRDQLQPKGSPEILARLVATNPTLGAGWNPQYSFAGVHAVVAADVQGKPLADNSLVQVEGEEEIL